MMDGTDRIEFPDAEVLVENQAALLCRVNAKLVSIPLGRMLPGTTVRQQEDRGTVVLTREVAVMLGLV
jgi:hypothetical protein